MAKRINIMGIIIFFILGLFCFSFSEEQITITTYYPSPYGSYKELTAHRMKIGTTYSQSSVPVADNNLIVEGKVGIGVIDPILGFAAAKLLVAGNLMFTEDWSNISGFGLKIWGADRTHVALQSEEGSGNVIIGASNPQLWTEKLTVKGNLRFTEDWSNIYGQGLKIWGYNNSHVALQSEPGTGNVIIGASNPSVWTEKLTIKGSIRFTEDWSNIYNEGNLKIWTTGGGNLILQESGLPLKRPGLVGIGTASPRAKLDLQASDKSRPTNICVRVNYTGGSTTKRCPDGYFIAVGSYAEGMGSLPSSGYFICCQACVDSGGGPGNQPDGLCD